MAKAELEIILSKLQGRLKGDSEFYVTNRHGKTVVSNYPLHKNKKKLTANQRAIIHDEPRLRALCREWYENNANCSLPLSLHSRSPFQCLA